MFIKYYNISALQCSKTKTAINRMACVETSKVHEAIERIARIVKENTFKSFDDTTCQEQTNFRENELPNEYHIAQLHKSLKLAITNHDSCKSFASSSNKELPPPSRFIRGNKPTGFGYFNRLDE